MSGLCKIGFQFKTLDKKGSQAVRLGVAGCILSGT
jgi:hypothetical protein